MGGGGIGGVALDFHEGWHPEPEKFNLHGIHLVNQWEWAGTNGYQAPKPQMESSGWNFLVLPKKDSVKIHEIGWGGF